jgi:hypothetical protein
LADSWNTAARIAEIWSKINSFGEETKGEKERRERDIHFASTPKPRSWSDFTKRPAPGLQAARLRTFNLQPSTGLHTVGVD